jgi:HEAT repeat protein
VRPGGEKAGALALCASSTEASIAGRTIDSRAFMPKEAPAAAAGVPATVPESRRAAIVLGAMALLTTIVYFVFREPPEVNRVPNLLKQLHHQEAPNRLAAARMLKQLGPRASEAIPDLVHLLRTEPDEEVRVTLAEALLVAGPGTVAYFPELEFIKQQEPHPGIRQMIDQLMGK